nr:MAG TPA: hypothetical protein [Caudoviricetes sp.]
MSTATEDLSRALKAAAESSAAYARQLTEQYRKEFELAREKVGLSKNNFIDSTYSGSGISAKGFQFVETSLGNLWGAFLPGATISDEAHLTIPKVLANNATNRGLTAESSMEERVKFIKEMLGVDSLNEVVNRMNAGN